MEEELYRKFYEVEERHWWFVARQRIVMDLISTRLGLPAGSRVLDVGCGTGAILSALSRNFEAYGTDTSTIAIEFCRKRGISTAFRCSLDQFPQQDLKFDLITLLDVIEHVDDDVNLLGTSLRYLGPEGYVLITVPAYQFLWSHHDEINHHRRRYVRSSLKLAMEQSGYQVVWISYFNTLLFPLALVDRMIKKMIGSVKDTSLHVPAQPVNSLLREVFASERYPLRYFALPFGLSLMAIGRKKS